MIFTVLPIFWYIYDGVGASVTQKHTERMTGREKKNLRR